MTQETLSFTDILNEYVGHSAYRPGQLARLTGVPKMTIVNWLGGRVKRPRAWQDVAKLARVLHLPASDADTLLRAAGYPSLEKLRHHTEDDMEQHLLAFWAEVGASNRARPSPFQIIPDLPTFVGRQELLAHLQKMLLAAYQTGAVMVSGAVGKGKTALAVHLAYQLRSSFPDGMLWARLDATPVMSVLQLWGEAYGRDVSKYKDVSSRSTAVRELLADKRALIVLDNVQHEEQLTPLLPANGPCAVLVTSRRRDLLALPGSHRFHIGAFTETEAMALWAKVLGGARVAREQAQLQEIAKLVGYHPLALDLAACRLAYEAGWETAVFHQYLQKETERLSLLAQGKRSLTVSLETSYQLLSPTLQQFLLMLSILPGVDFGIPEAAAVAGLAVADADDYLRELFCLSWLRQGYTEERYRLIPVLQDFVREKIV